MAAVFQTDLVTPDKHDGVSGFFRVVGPLLTFVILAAFFRYYYLSNGYELPLYLGGMLTFVTILLATYLLFSWYHGKYDVEGRIAFGTEEVAYEWLIDGGEDKRERSHKLADLSNLKIIYDGAAGFLSPAKGTENQFCFTHEGTDYALNFYLESEDDVEEFGEIIKKWYEQGIALTEYNTEGEERYLLIYEAKHKKAIPQVA